MGELFLTVLNMSLTASYLILFVMFIRLPLKKAPKFISYALWVVVAFRLISPFSFESIFSLIPQNTTIVTIPRDIIYQQSPQINSGIQASDSSANNILPAPVIGNSINPLQVCVDIGTYIWILGIIILLSHSVLSVLKLKKQLKGAQLTKQNIYESEHLKTPFVLGIARPKIFLPAHLSKEERHYILLHEQTHIQRKDHLIKMFAFLIAAVHWFNPLVWIAFRLMSLDMEYSCDESVLKSLDKTIKKTYAASLLTLATDRHILNGSPLAFGEGNVKGRIKNVLNYKRPKFWVVAASIVILIGLGMMLLSNPIHTEQDLSFLKPSNILSMIADQEQVKIISSDHNETFVSGTELAKWLDRAENNWKRKSVSSPYELSPSIVIHVNDDTKNEIRFYESEPTLAMVLYQNEYRYYKIPEEDYQGLAAITRLGYPHVQRITFTEYENYKKQTSVIMTDNHVIMQMAVLMQSGEKYRPSLFYEATMNDTPAARNYIRIDMSGDKAGASYFVYTENDNTSYIDAPYEHINKIDQATLKSILSIFKQTGNELPKEQAENTDVAKYDTVKVAFLSDLVGFKPVNQFKITEANTISYIASEIQSCQESIQEPDLVNNHTNQYTIELSNTISGYSCKLYYDTLYDKAYLEKDGGLYEADTDFARYIDSFMENTDSMVAIADEEAVKLFDDYGWTLDYKISTIKDKLKDVNALYGFNPNSYYYAYHNELSKDIGLDMKNYPNTNINVDIYRIHQPMPQKFYPIQNARGIVVKNNEAIIGAFISAGRHSTFNACSLKGKSFEEVTGQPLDQWFSKVVKADNMEEKLSELRPQQVIETYFTALNQKDAKTAAFCISKKTLLGALTSNMSNKALFNPGISLPLTDTDMEAKSNFDNLKSASLVKEKLLEEENKNTKIFEVTVNLAYNKEVTIGSGEQSWICRMVYESPQTGWKIEGFGH